MASASSMPSANQRQDLKSLLECSICLETFDEPRTLPCLHSFCKKCLENFVHGKRDDELNCPVCRTKFALNKEEGVAGMTRNHFICNMVEVMSIQHQDKCIPCSHCQQASVGRCVTCEMFMCEKCFKPHNDYPGFKDHLVLTMEELSKPENQSKIKGKSYCKKHSDKKLKLYCETCEELICTYCMSFEHVRPDHVCSPLREIAERKREELKANCENLQSTVAKKNNEMDVLKEQIGSLTNDFDKTQRLINETKEQLLAKVHDTVDKKANSMIEGARQVFNRNTRILEERVHKKETFVNRVKATTNMSRSLIQSGNDEEIVRSFQSVVNNTIHETFGEEQMGDSLSWSSDEIETTLLAEIKNITENKAGPVALVEEIVKKLKTNEQWYSNDEGMVHLQLLFQYFQEAGITPEMCSNTITEDMEFGFSGGYYLDFPANFPKKMPTIHAPDGRKRQLKRSSGDDDVCRMVVDSVVAIFRNLLQSSRRGGGGRGGSQY